MEREGQNKVAGVLWPIAGAALCLLLGHASGSSTDGANSEWFRFLRKPPGYPPAWMFGVVWSVLYLMMGIAAGRLIHLRSWSAVGPFVIQFLLNLAWTPVFFGWQKAGWALVILFGIWLFLALTIRQADRSDKVAAWLLLPYLFWLMFAAYLNGAILWLNR